MAVDTATRAALPTLGWLPRYGELLRTLVRRELRTRFKGSALGLFWSLIYPLAMIGVYTLVFSVLWRVTGDIPHYPLFVLSGLAVWGFFQAGIQLGTTSLVANGELIKKVWFPRELVPASAVLAQTVTIFVMLAILIPIDLIVEPENARTVVLVIPIVAALICLVLGLAWLFSVANVFYRDVEHLLAVVVPALVLPHAGAVRARAVQRRQLAPLADPADALREPGHAVRRGRARGRAAGDACRARRCCSTSSSSARSSRCSGSG